MMDQYYLYTHLGLKLREQWTNEVKLTLLLQSLGTDENTKYTNLILPKSWRTCHSLKRLKVYLKSVINVIAYSTLGTSVYILEKNMITLLHM